MHISALDGLRGLAALIVFVSHYTLLSGMLDGLLGNGSGQLGVMIFFCLSGFLMGHLYLDHRPTLYTVYRYIVRRFIRIVPLFYFVVLSAFALHLVFPDFNFGYPVVWANLDDHLLFIRGVGAFWTIPVEVQFYLIFVAIWIVFFKKRPLLVLLIITITFIYLHNPYWLNFLSKMRIFTPVITYFLLGILAYSLSNFQQRNYYDFIFGFFLISLFCLFPRVYEKLFSIPLRELNGALILSLWNSPLYMAVTFGLLFSLVHSKIFYKVLSVKFFTVMGKISYSFYLLHVPALFVFKQYFSLKEYPIAAFFVCLPAILAISLFSFYFFEKPMSRLLASFFLRAGRNGPTQN